MNVLTDKAQLERDIKTKHRFMLKIDGVNVFQWFRNKAKEFLAKLGIRPKEPRKGTSLVAKTIVTGSIVTLGGERFMFCYVRMADQLLRKGYGCLTEANTSLIFADSNARQTMHLSHRTSWLKRA